jgi:hypothetical protein
MSLPSNVPELAIPQNDAADEAEISRCLEGAAELVQNFADLGAISALDAVLAAAGDAASTGTDSARLAAAAALTQTTTLHDEVSRFFSLTSK